MSNLPSSQRRIIAVSSITIITCILPKHILKPILSDYRYHKNEKGKTCKMDLPLLENDITGSEQDSKIKIHSETVEKVQFWLFF
jgi:hypothetical protein